MANLFRNGSFNFIGVLGYSDAPLNTKKLSDTSKWSRTRLNVSVRNDNNSQFLNMEYIHSDSVNTCKILGKDGAMFEVALTDTAKPETIEKSADFTRITIDLETDFEKKKQYLSLIFKKRNHEMKKDDEKTQEDLDKIKEYEQQIKELATNRITFCHMQDVVKFLNSALPAIGKQKVRVTGQVKCNYYNGKNNLQYIPSLIELVPEETENQLKVFVDFFYDKDGIDDDTKEKKMIVNGYIGEKVKKVDKLYPLAVAFDYTKVDEENPQHKMLLDYMKGIFKITNKKEVHKIGLELNVLNGAETVEFNEDCLTDQQKMEIALGLSKLEDFKPRGNIYGNRIQELRVFKPDSKNYPEGSVEVFPVDELETYLSYDDSDVKLSDVKKDETKEEVKEESNAAPSTEDLMKSLFS